MTNIVPQIGRQPLPPTTFHVIPALPVVLPVPLDEARAGAGRKLVMTGNPEIIPTLPPIETWHPHVPGPRRGDPCFDDRRRRAYAHVETSASVRHARRRRGCREEQRAHEHVVVFHRHTA